MLRCKKNERNHKTLFITCIVVFALLFIIHSAYMYKAVEAMNTLHLAAFLIGVFIIQMLFYTVTALGFLIFGKINLPGQFVFQNDIPKKKKKKNL